MAKLKYAHVNDELGDGEFRFMRTDVTHADDGHDNLKLYAPFDQGDWQKDDTTGTSIYSKGFDSGTSRVYESLAVNTLVGGAGVYTIRRRLLLPRDFGRSGVLPEDPGAADGGIGLFDANAISLFTYRDGAVSDIKATLLYAGAADGGVNGVSVNPGAASTWTMFTLSPSGTYAPGQFVTLQIEYDANTAAIAIRVADIIVAYRSARGNA